MPATRFTTAAEKIACYDQVAAIIEDRLALESFRWARGATFDTVLLARDEAYCTIVTAVLGREALQGGEPSKPVEAPPSPESISNAYDPSASKQRVQ